VLNLNSIVADMGKMLGRLIGEEIELRTILNPELGSVKADPSQIEQVLMNLAVNARDAMPRGGKLTIETANVSLREGSFAQRFIVPAGDYVKLVVTDTGTGMDAETKARIFEPFFTTKESGRGTGLGLSTVYGIVKQSGGYILVYTEPERGTAFKIYLPRVDERVEEYPQAVAIQEHYFQGTETILLAEDDNTVRELTRELLEIYGYTVLEASNGGSALLLCESYEEPIHLLLTDVVMPEMSGHNLASRLAQLRPEMKVLYMSGYTDDVIVHRGVLVDGTAFIQKPFAPDALARKIREVLDDSGMH
jgi:CheY-like chemotaxis protein